MKLAIIGSRGFSDYPRLSLAIDQYFSDNGALAVTEIISGGAVGADSLGARFAREHGIKLTEHLPNWDLYGKRAGFVRNELIIKDADMVLAFWGVDPKTGEYSRGTGHSLSIAKRMKKTSLIIYF